MLTQPPPTPTPPPSPPSNPAPHQHNHTPCTHTPPSPQGTEGHNTAQIGGFVMLPPVVMANLAAGRDAARAAALKHLGVTHDSAKLAAFAGEYAGLLYDLATGVR